MRKKNVFLGIAWPLCLEFADIIDFKNVKLKQKSELVARYFLWKPELQHQYMQEEMNQRKAAF